MADFKEFSLTCIWVIENFRFIRICLESEKISAGDLNETEWQASMETLDGGGSRVSCKLKRTDGGESLDLGFRLSIIDEVGNLKELKKIVNQRIDNQENSSICVAANIGMSSYPYDSLRLCWQIFKPNKPPTSPQIVLLRSIIVKKSVVKNFDLNRKKIKQVWIFTPADEDLPSFRLRPYLANGCDFYVEFVKQGPVFEYGVTAYCKMTLLSENKTQTFLKDGWFYFEAESSANVRHLTNVISGHVLRKYPVSFSLNCELSLSINHTFSFVEEIRYISKKHSIKEDMKLSLPHLQLCDASVSKKPQSNLDRKFVSCSNLSAPESINPSKGQNRKYDSCSNLRAQTIEKTEGSLLDEIWQLYDEEKFSDVRIYVSQRSFSVHKIILSARSKVFGSMLQSNMREKLNGVVRIDDTTPEVMEHFLDFIYSDILSADLPFEMVKQLYVVSDKYQVMLLRQKCSDILKVGLTTSNVCEILVLADMHQDVDLKKETQMFVNKNSDVVFKSETWTSFMAQKTNLAAEVMHFCLMNKSF